MGIDQDGDGVITAVDVKLWYARLWLYIASTLGIILVLLLAPWWVSLTIAMVLIVFAAFSNWLLGRWLP